MKKLLSGLVIFILFLAGCTKTEVPTQPTDDITALQKKGDCITIQQGVVKYSAGHYLAGQAIGTGYDIFGYNYQAMMFKGSYANVYLGGEGLEPYTGNDVSYLAANPSAANKWYWPYRDVELVMKWNEAWISNKDCSPIDGKLDRHPGFTSYIGSGAWETNHMRGDGWTAFSKIVAVPANATKTGGVWYDINGVEIGPDIWGEFAVIQEVESGAGATYVSPAGPGFGKW